MVKRSIDTCVADLCCAWKLSILTWGAWLGFEWSTVDITAADQLEELYQLLNLNYVEDDDNMFRFDYSKDFLRWALTPPGWKPVWHLGIRNAANKKLLAFISGIPAELRCVDQYVMIC
jgi:glycylpeptide N-tetradecanoyltransferase